jgi:hypothetical protein
MTEAMPDIERVRAFLGGWCDGGVALDRLEPCYVKLRPDGAALVLYEGPGTAGTPLRLTARRVDGRKGNKLESEINRRFPSGLGPGGQAGFTRAAIHAPELRLLFQVFPADRRLLSLPVAVDGRSMVAVLEAALADRSGGARVVDVVARVMRYKPERKCLLRYDVTWDAPSAPAVVWAKVARTGRFARTRDILQQLRDGAPALAFELPEPLGVVPDLCMELFSHVRGVPLSDLVGTEGLPDLCRQVAVGLRQLHALPVVMPQEWDREAKLARLADDAAEFVALLPSAERRLERLARVIGARLGSSGPTEQRPIHRDFHGDNVLVDGTRLGLVDLEDCAMGDPADDVGSMCAQLRWLAIKAGAGDGGRPSLADGGWRAFLETYLEHAGAGTLAGVVAHTAMHCFLYAFQCLRHPPGRDRHRQATALLAAAEEVLARGLR